MSDADIKLIITVNPRDIPGDVVIERTTVTWLDGEVQSYRGLRGEHLKILLRDNPPTASVELEGADITVAKKT